MLPLYHQPRGSESFMDDPWQKHRRRRRVHVVQTGFEGQDWLGNIKFNVRGRSWPFSAHVHIVNPLLVQMSARVVAPRYNQHRCTCTSSFCVMPGKFDRCSMMNTSLCLWGCIQWSDSNRRCVCVLSRNSHRCER